MSAAAYRRTATAATVAAIAFHAAALALPMFHGHRGVTVLLAVPLVAIIEALALLGTAAYLRSILRFSPLKKQTQIGVFTGSLALALTVPALFIPAWARSGTENLLLSSPTHSPSIAPITCGTSGALAHPMLGFWLWAASLTGIGIAIHLITVARWRSAICAGQHER